MNIPLVDLRKQYAPLKQEILGGIERVFDGMQLFLGENLQTLEKEFARFCGAQCGIGVADGTAALSIILRIRAAQRDELQAWLKSRGVSTGIHYPIAAHLQKAFAYLGYCPGNPPVTERIVMEVLSLPMHAELTEEEIEYVANSIQAFYSRLGG